RDSLFTGETALSSCRPPVLRVHLLDKNVLELHQTGRASPLAVPLAAMMLQGEPAARRQVRDLRAGDDGLAVEYDRHGVAGRGDLEVVLLADRLIGLGARGGGGAQLG